MNLDKTVIHRIVKSYSVKKKKKKMYFQNYSSDLLPYRVTILFNIVVRLFLIHTFIKYDVTVRHNDNVYFDAPTT